MERKITRADIYKLLNKGTHTKPVTGASCIISVDVSDVLDDTLPEPVVETIEPIEEETPKTTKKKSTKKTQTEETPADTESEPVE